MQGETLESTKRPQLDSKRKSTHGRDFIFIELADPERNQTKVRLPGVHVGSGRYVFPYWDRVFPGHWTATFYLWATARQPLLTARGDFNALLHTDYIFRIYDYVLGAKRAVLRTKLKKRTARGDAVIVPNQAGGEDVPHDGAGVTGYALNDEQPLCTLPSKGQWVPVPANATECPRGLCEGPLDPLLFDSRDSLAMGFRDVYRPYDCRYRIFTDAEVAQCSAGKMLGLVGDSRISEFRGYLNTYLPGLNQTGFLIQPFRVGLRALLPGTRKGSGTGGGLAKLLSTFDVLVISSELHDMADYKEPFSVYASYGFQQGDPRVALAAAEDQQAAPTTRECAPRNATAAERVKYRPVAQYLETLREFASHYLQVRAELEHSGALRARRVLWFFTGYQPHATPACIPNQLERMACLQHLELAEVARAGWEPLDFATMLQDGPAEWMFNDAHVSATRGMAKRRKSSGVAMMEAHALLNALCNGR